jgi:hypothetical protein
MNLIKLTLTTRDHQTIIKIDGYIEIARNFEEHPGVGYIIVIVFEPE